MSNVFDAAWVIARRDFVATVWSRTFLLFLLAPIIAVGFGVIISTMTEQADIQARQPNVGVLMEPDSAAAVRAANARLAHAVGAFDVPELKLIDPEDDGARQAERLLADSDSNIAVILTGTLARPTLTGPEKATQSVERVMALIIEDARRSAAMQSAGIRELPVAIRTVTTEKSGGSVNMVRHGLARIGQGIIFVLTLLLAGMLLSNLVEEKSNKVIEVLAAAVPLDAVFLGKLIAMLGVSVVGVIIWGGIAGVALLWIQDWISVPVTPAVGWPAYCLLLLLYFAANYMLLGSVFLGIGGQASNVREVQTLSMPITFAQVMIFALASAVVGNNGGTMTMIAAIFPLSSPMAMIAIAAQSGTIWWHLVALVWQFVWVALIIRVSARLFRLTVLKSASPEGFFAIFQRKRRDTPLP
ncbi:MAG TPA: ABC transporter permease [Allosphingosinicella sp.]|jgi:ABC-2 type transport system permease protein